MTDNACSRAWFRLAVVYFAAGVALGVAMGASGDHRLMPVHAHVNLLGWVSMSLFGLLGMARPALTEGRLARWQFWLYNLGLPVMLLALAGTLLGQAALGPLIGIASAVVGLAVLLFAGLVLTRLGAVDSAAAVRRAAGAG